MECARVAAVNTGTNFRYIVRPTARVSTALRISLPAPAAFEIEKIDFKKLIKADAVLHVRDALEINLQMTLGSALETITVEAGAPLVNTESVAVSTVIDRTFNPLYQVGGPRSVQLALKLQF